jgi:hypothetical protein
MPATGQTRYSDSILRITPELLASRILKSCKLGTIQCSRQLGSIYGFGSIFCFYDTLVYSIVKALNRTIFRWFLVFVISFCSEA